MHPLEGDQTAFYLFIYSLIKVIRSLVGNAGHIKKNHCPWSKYPHTYMCKLVNMADAITHVSQLPLQQTQLVHGL